MNERTPTPVGRLRVLCVAVLSLTLGLMLLNGLFGQRTIAQEQRKLDLRDKLKDKKFTNGRHTIEELPTGEKIQIEVKDGQIADYFLINAEGKEFKARINSPNRSARKHESTVEVVTAVCTATISYTLVDKKTGKQTPNGTMIVDIQCPNNLPGVPNQNSNSNSNSNSSSKSKP